MIEIRRKAFKEYFKVTEQFLYFGARDIPTDIKLRRWFNPMTLLSVLAAVLMVGSLLNSLYFFLSIALLGFLFMTYKQTERSTQWIDIRREIPARVTHKQTLKVKLTIHNKTEFPVEDLIIKDTFTLSPVGEKTLWLGYRLEPRSKLKIEYEIKVDGEMGWQTFGPMEAVLTDPLGLFEFRRIDDALQKIEVMPALNQKLNSMPTQSLFSHSLGNHESPHRGDSVSFFELRNYIPGDPLKRVSWKLSSKFQKLLVKEFEDLISEDTTVYLDFDESHHFGLPGSNTWEALKETAISILMSKEKNIQLQVLSQNLYLPFGTGPSHTMLAVGSIRELKPVPGDAQPLALKLQSYLPFGSSLLYIGPTFGEYPERLIDTFRLLRNQGIQMRAVLIDTSSFAIPTDRPELESALVSPRQRTKTTLKELTSMLLSMGIPYTVVRREDLAA